MLLGVIYPGTERKIASFGLKSVLAEQERKNLKNELAKSSLLFFPFGRAFQPFAQGPFTKRFENGGRP